MDDRWRGTGAALPIRPDCNHLLGVGNPSTSNSRMTDIDPGTEKELLSMYEKLETLIVKTTNDLAGKYTPEERVRKVEEAKALRRQVIEKLGYQPKTEIDQEVDVLRQMISNGESVYPEIHIGPRGGRYRINRNGHKSYDV